MNVRLLRRIAKVIQLPENKGQFNMKFWHFDKTERFRHDGIYGVLCNLPKEKQVSCDTAHCIAGWAQVLSPDRDCEEYAYGDGMRVLGLDDEEAERLFMADNWPRGFGGWNSTPAQAAARIEHFIKTKGKK